MLKNRPLVFAKPVEVETAVEEVLVLDLVETLDEEVVEEVALAEEEVVLATELVDLDVDVVVAGAAPENVRNGVSKFPQEYSYLECIGNSMDYMMCMYIQLHNLWAPYRLSHHIVRKETAGHWQQKQTRECRI
jgi:hypothetical protein